MSATANFRNAWKKGLLSVLGLVFFSFSFSQSVSTYWKYMNPAPLGNHFFDQYYVNNNVGYACGDAGVIARTTDGGHSWVYDYIPTREALQAIQFVSETTGYAVGVNGRVVKTTNRGITWDSVAVRPRMVQLNNLFFFDANNGIVVGNSSGGSATIYRTTDGGASWTSLAASFPVQTKNIQGISFINSSIGYVSGTSGLVAKTTDGGNTWTNISLVAGNPVPIGGAGSIIAQSYPGLGVVDAQTVIISSQNNSYIVKTSDGGATWVVKGAQTVNAALNIPGSQQMWNIAVKGSSVVVSMGSFAGISSDKGETWKLTKPFPFSTPVGSILFYCPFITADNSVKLVGMYGISTDSVSGGAGWDRSYYKNINYNPIDVQNLFSISHLDKNNVLIGGANGTLYRSTDGGASWVNKSIPEFMPPDYMPVSILDIKFPAANAAYMACGNGYVYRSFDKGDNWPDPYAFNAGKPVWSMDFTDANTGWFSCGTGSAGSCSVFRTTDGGASWTPQSGSPFGGAAYLLSIDFINSSTGWAVGGTNGKIFKTTNGGINWTPQNAPATVTGLLYSVSFANADTGYAAGAGGKVIRTIDGGATWTDISPVGLLGVVNKITFINGKSGVLFAMGGVSYKTTDAGNTWTYFAAPSNDVLANASIIAPYNTQNNPGGPDLDMMVVGGRLFGALSPVIYQVRVFHNSAVPLTPVITNVNDKCPNSATAKGKLLNPPAFTQIDITVDGVPVLYYPADSSFIYYENGITGAGTHTVRVRYINTGGNVFKDVSYQVYATLFTPQVSISSSDADNIICPGQPVTFTAVPVNGGQTPSYRWQVNHIDVGTNAGSYTYTPANGDRVSVILNSSFACVTTNSVIAYNNPVEVPSFNPVIAAQTANTIGVVSLDNGATYQWFKDGQLIPGATGIIFKATGFGSYTVQETFRTCSQMSNAVVIAPKTGGADLVIYPVPAITSLYAQTGSSLVLVSQVKMYDVSGKLIREYSFTNSSLVECNISMLPAGVYVAKFETSAGTVVKKFVKQ